jgi:4'-phosphopantetheinyl transferase
MPEHLDTAAAHVWTVPLDAPNHLRKALSRCLSESERRRLDGCATEVAARRFALGRGALRHVLSLYAGRPPAAISLLHGELGKPTLPDDDDIHFSMSHSLDLALIVVARTEVGIDMEHLRRPARMERISRRLFHPDTVALLERLDTRRRTHAFLDAWTLREAHVKAVGGGLFRTADVIPFDPNHEADGLPRMVRERTGSPTSGGSTPPIGPVAWCVARFVPADGLRATLVARAHLASVHVHDAAHTVRRLTEITNQETA